jgi:hypothetical protein
MPVVLHSGTQFHLGHRLCQELIKFIDIFFYLEKLLHVHSFETCFSGSKDIRLAVSHIINKF